MGEAQDGQMAARITEGIEGTMGMFARSKPHRELLTTPFCQELTGSLPNLQAVSLKQMQVYS